MEFVNPALPFLVLQTCGALQTYNLKTLWQRLSLLLIYKYNYFMCVENY